MISPENAAKIQNLAYNFEPLSIPMDVVLNPNCHIICGSLVSERTIRQRFLVQYQVPQQYWAEALS